MNTEPQRSEDAWAPITTKNRPREWVAAILFSAVSCWFVMAYHDWGRAKPYSIGTLSEALAHTAFYGLALAFAIGPLYRFGIMPARAVAGRRPFGIVAVICAMVHALLSLTVLRPNSGWDHFVVKHWDHTVLGVLGLVLAVILLATSFGNAFQRLGEARWFRIQAAGLAILPVALLHFMALGKFTKWADWFDGRDRNAAPPGTIVIFCVGVLVITLRIIDIVRHWKKRSA